MSDQESIYPFVNRTYIGKTDVVLGKPVNTKTVVDLPSEGACYVNEDGKVSSRFQDRRKVYRAVRNTGKGKYYLAISDSKEKARKLVSEDYVKTLKPSKKGLQ